MIIDRVKLMASIDILIYDKTFEIQFHEQNCNDCKYDNDCLILDNLYEDLETLEFCLNNINNI